ncbi:ThuA domain-containing protein [Xanthomonas sp. 3058]|uniref:ThuA domain-containing protein n=1 Tax=Xanthomonas sp. 3058 TaxID=3035314 RepID=UPI002DD6B9E0|nr:ThuA domain-containing protein [Xanthomonas sp. 3058]
MGRSFRAHPYRQTAMVDVVDANSPPPPASKALGMDRRMVRVRSALQRRSGHAADGGRPMLISPGQVARGMGKQHPVAWYRHFEGGRVFATALGHLAEAYNDPRYFGHLDGGIYWAAAGRGVGETVPAGQRQRAP